MIHYKFLDLLDQFLMVLMDNDVMYMGGKLVIMMHDFWQILSVTLQGRHTDIVSAAVTSSEIYDQFTQLHLRWNIRVQRFL
jgi:hypothetical protein